MSNTFTKCLRSRMNKSHQLLIQAENRKCELRKNYQAEMDTLTNNQNRQLDDIQKTIVSNNKQKEIWSVMYEHPMMCELNVVYNTINVVELIIIIFNYLPDKYCNKCKKMYVTCCKCTRYGTTLVTYNLAGPMYPVSEPVSVPTCWGSRSFICYLANNDTDKQFVKECNELLQCCHKDPLHLSVGTFNITKPIPSFLPPKLSLRLYINNLIMVVENQLSL